MAAPKLITACITDINNKKLKGKDIPPMGGLGGAGCKIISVDVGVIEIEYLAKKCKKGNPFKVTQKEYTTFEQRFNSLTGWNNHRKCAEKYVVSQYTDPKWHGPFGRVRDPLLPTVFKALGY